MTSDHFLSRRGVELLQPYLTHTLVDDMTGVIRSRVAATLVFSPTSRVFFSAYFLHPDRLINRKCNTSVHTPSIAFTYLLPNSTEGALFISAKLSTDAVSAVRKVWILTRLEATLLANNHVKKRRARLSGKNRVQPGFRRFWFYLGLRNVGGYKRNA